MTTWHASLSTSFEISNRLVHVAIVGQHADTGKPIISLTWSSRPASLSAADMAAFEAKRRAAVAVLHQRLERLSTTRGSTTRGTA